MTIVGFCVDSFRLDPSPPVLVSSGQELDPVGGFFSDHGQGRVNFSLYPPTEALEVAVRDDQESVARLRFEPVEAQSCGVRIRESSQVSLLGCDSLLVLAWNTSLEYRAERVELADVEVRPVAGSPPLDFYLHRLGRSAAGTLRIEFAIPYPAHPSVTLRLRELYVEPEAGKDLLRVRPDERVRILFEGLDLP